MRSATRLDLSMPSKEKKLATVVQWKWENQTPHSIAVKTHRLHKSFEQRIHFNVFAEIH